MFRFASPQLFFGIWNVQKKKNDPRILNKRVQQPFTYNSSLTYSFVVFDHKINLSQPVQPISIKSAPGPKSGRGEEWGNPDPGTDTDQEGRVR